MRLAIAGKHVEVTDALKSHVETRLTRVRHHFDKVIDADVVLTVEKHRHMAEITLHANGVRIHGKESSNDMYASVDAVVDKIDRQIQKFNQRLRRFQARKGHAVIREVEAASEAAQQEMPEPEVVRAGNHVIVREPLTLKPMSPHEAMLQLELANDSFFVFTNSDTQAINVLYAKEDGTFGLVEPER